MKNNKVKPLLPQCKKLTQRIQRPNESKNYDILLKSNSGFKDLMRVKPIKLLQENIAVNQHDLGFSSSFADRTSKSNAIEEKQAESILKLVSLQHLLKLINEFSKVAGHKSTHKNI